MTDHLTRGERNTIVTAAAETPAERTDGPIHVWFGLTYSSHLVLPRVLMQSMPVDWQQRMVGCLEEIREAFAHIDPPGSYIVKAAVDCYYDKLSDADLKQLGITVDPAPEDDAAFDRWVESDRFHDADGTAHHGQEHVLVPVADPLPHYRRCYIAPREVA